MAQRFMPGKGVPSAVLRNFWFDTVNAYPPALRLAIETFGIDRLVEGCRSAGIGCIQCKGWAADALVQVLEPIQTRRAGFSEAQVKNILEDGSKRATARSEQTMREVHTAMHMTLSGTVGD